MIKYATWYFNEYFKITFFKIDFTELDVWPVFFLGSTAGIKLVEVDAVAVDRNNDALTEALTIDAFRWLPFAFGVVKPWFDDEPCLVRFDFDLHLTFFEEFGFKRLAWTFKEDEIIIKIGALNHANSGIEVFKQYYELSRHAFFDEKCIPFTNNTFHHRTTHDIITSLKGNY